MSLRPRRAVGVVDGAAAAARWRVREWVRASVLCCVLCCFLWCLAVACLSRVVC